MGLAGFQVRMNLPHLWKNRSVGRQLMCSGVYQNGSYASDRLDGF